MRILVLLLLGPALLLAQGRTVSQPLTVAPGGRHLQLDGRPFFWLADTAWELFHRLDRPETEAYLENRRAKGFTVIQAVLLAEIEGLTAPNRAGHLPLEAKDPARPVESYFAHADWVVARANQAGLWVGLLPTWGKYWKPGPDRIFDEANARAYGLFLGRRYRDRQIVWILGGDQNIETPEEQRLIDAMAAGLRKGDGGRHLITFHPRGPGRSGEQLAGAPWLDFHMSQSSHGARDHDNGLYAELDRKLTPPRPTLDGEPRYEGITVGFYLTGANPSVRFDDADVRQAAWWSVLAGACGHTYGHGSVWQMWRPGLKPILGANVPWREALDHPGAFQMGHLRRLLESRSFASLVPDNGELLLDAPRSGGAKVRAALDSGRSFAVVYSPQGAPFSLNRGLLPSRRIKETWYDPRIGVAYVAHTGSNGGVQTYTPPTSGRGQDWVLVLEDPDAKLPPLPGAQ